MLIDKENLTDEQLMKLYQSGDEEAFKVLYIRHSSKIYGFLQKRLKKSDVVADVYQEVFIKIHKSKSLYNDSLPALAWIFTVTRTTMIDALRKNKDVPVVDNYDLDKLPETSERKSPQLEEAVESLAFLPGPQQTAIQMRYIDDKTFEQIAESLNVSPANARQMISRGLRRLKELVSDGGKS